MITGANETYVDLGVIKQVPTPWIFAASAVVALLVVLPVHLLRRFPEPPNPGAASEPAMGEDAV